MYKYDMHVHTIEASPCGKVKGREVVRKYRELGYDGLVITDHYSDRFLLSIGKGTWDMKVKRFLAGYREAFKEGRKQGLRVFLGMEINFRWSLNDYLVYGIDEKFLFKNHALHRMKLKKFKKLADERGYLIYQAHPYRLGMTRAKPCLLDGVEVYNGNPRHNSRNELAMKFARENSLRMISGSDFHRLEDVGRGGVFLPENPQNSRELVNMLRENRISSLVTVDQSQ